jgi:hypothetical protein
MEVDTIFRTWSHDQAVVLSIIEAVRVPSSQRQAIMNLSPRGITRWCSNGCSRARVDIATRQGWFSFIAIVPGTFACQNGHP